MSLLLLLVSPSVRWVEKKYVASRQGWKKTGKTTGRGSSNKGKGRNVKCSQLFLLWPTFPVHTPLLSKLHTAVVCKFFFFWVWGALIPMSFAHCTYMSLLDTGHFCALCSICIKVGVKGKKDDPLYSHFLFYMPTCLPFLPTIHQPGRVFVVALVFFPQCSINIVCCAQADNVMEGETGPTDRFVLRKNQHETTHGKHIDRSNFSFF
jgi:hypothetical protein